MKFFHCLAFAVCLTFIAAYFLAGLLDWHIKQVVVATLQEITAPPR